MSHAALVAWIISVMTVIRPPSTPSFIPEAQETSTIAADRYAQIAQAIATVSEDRPLFKGNKAAIRTAALIVSVAFHESGFRRDVDLGLGRERLGKQGLNDHGRSWCMMQVHLGKRQVRTADGTLVEDSAQMTQEGWTGRELVTDRVKCFTAGRNALRQSMLACQKLGPARRLAAYARGTCDSASGQALSIARMTLSWRLVSQHPAFAETETESAAGSPARGATAAAQ